MTSIYYISPMERRTSFHAECTHIARHKFNNRDADVEAILIVENTETIFVVRSIRFNWIYLSTSLNPLEISDGNSGENG